MKSTVSLVLAFFTAAALVGCGGDGGGGGGGAEPTPVAVVPGATTLAASSTTTAAVTAIPFTFPAGVPELGTTAATTITFTNTATTPAFTIASGGNTASGITTFGSCIFQVITSTFPADHQLAAGKTKVIENCSIKVDTAGVHLDALAEDRTVQLLLGGSESTGERINIDVNPAGQLVVNGQVVGSVTIVLVTGT